MCLRARLPARPAGTTNGVPPVFTRFLLLTFCRSGMAMTVPWWLEPEPDKPQTQTSHPHSYHRICDMLTCHAKHVRIRLQVPASQTSIINAKRIDKKNTQLLIRF
jgi:hypothetical protein